MVNDISLPDPKRFNLASFADLLCSRPTMIGEEPGSFENFHDGMMASLAPMTPYECIIAENLVAIEWELFQQRRMREAGLRQLMRTAVRDAVSLKHRIKYYDKMDKLHAAYVERGGDAAKWRYPYPLDQQAIESEADELADGVTSVDPDVQVRALDEMASLGLEPLKIMADAYASWERSITRHDDKVQELERRRRDVKRDYDALVHTRPIEARAVDG